MNNYKWQLSISTKLLYYFLLCFFFTHSLLAMVNDNSPPMITAEVTRSLGQTKIFSPIKSLVPGTKCDHIIETESFLFEAGDIISYNGYQGKILATSMGAAHLFLHIEVLSVASLAFLKINDCSKISNSSNICNFSSGFNGDLSQEILSKKNINQANYVCKKTHLLIAIHHHKPFEPSSSDSERTEYQERSQSLINQLKEAGLNIIFLTTSTATQKDKFIIANDAIEQQSEVGRHNLAPLHGQVVITGGYLGYCHMRGMVGAIVAHFRKSNMPLTIHLPAEAITLQTLTMARTLDKDCDGDLLLQSHNWLHLMDKLLKNMERYEAFDNFQSPGIKKGEFKAENYQFILELNNDFAFTFGTADKIVYLKTWIGEEGQVKMFTQLQQ